jgi:agmatinase
VDIRDIREFLNPEQPESTQQASARFIVLPFPLEKTTSYIQGTARGPQAILDASSQVEFFDPELQLQALDHGIYTDHRLHDPAINQEDTKTVLARASGIVREYITNDQFVLTLGGEHTVTPGVATPFLDRYGSDLTILHFDAHADLKDTYEGSPYSHACAIRRIVQNSPIVSMGIRSLNDEEYAYAQQQPLITTFYAHDMAFDANWMQKAIDAVQTPYTYVTFDLDGLDPSIMQSVGTPQPGGILWHQALHVIKSVASKSKLVGADVNELCPIDGMIASDFLAAKLCYKIMGYSLLKD